MSLTELSVREFVQTLGSDNTTPGGGSAGALCGALAAALATMVARFTIGREKFRESWEALERVQQQAEVLKERLLELVQKDTDAYNRVMDAYRKPKSSDEEKAHRRDAIEIAFQEAAIVPLETLKLSTEAMGLCRIAMEHGNPNTLTDAAVGIEIAHAASRAAAYNVLINLQSIQDPIFLSTCREEVDGFLARVDETYQAGEAYIRKHLVDTD